MIRGASAVVLAGGASRRMGRDKRLLPWGEDADGRPRTLLQSVIDSLVAVADDVIVVANDQPVVAGARVVPDAIPGAGSLGGILSGVEAARHDRVFVAAADMPFLHAGLVRHLLDRLEGHDAVVPVVDGRPEPLHAVYGPAVAPAARTQIERGQLKIALAFRGSTCSGCRKRTYDSWTPGCARFATSTRRRTSRAPSGTSGPTRTDVAAREPKA